MTEFKDELRELIVKKFGSVSAFARAADLPATTVYSVLNRGVGGASFDVVTRIYDTLQIDWGNMTLGGPVKSKIEGKALGADPFVDVPVFSDIAAGQPMEMWTVDFTAPVPAEVIKKHPVSALMRVNGNSVNKRLRDGMFVLIDLEDREPTNESDLFAVCVNGDTATLKRYRPLENGCELLPDSYDPTIRPLVFDYNEDDTPEVTIMGKAVFPVAPLDFEI